MHTNNPKAKRCTDCDRTKHSNAFRFNTGYQPVIRLISQICRSQLIPRAILGKSLNARNICVLYHLVA